MLRRDLFGMLFAGAASRLLAQNADPCTSCQNISPSDPWKALEEGNRRFLDGKLDDRKDKCRLACTSGTQKPFAVVLTCADSRVAPEVLFDQRIGDLFVVRVAGNVATDEAVGSIEYAVDHLHTPTMIVVLGHEKCGAVDAVLQGEPAPGMVPSVLNRIYPAVQGIGKEDLDKAIRANVALTARVLPRYSAVIRSHKTPVVGAVYSVQTGRVTRV
jgi:carbonic anhydrase